MNIKLKKAIGSIPAGVPVQVAGYHFNTTWAGDGLYAYDVDKAMPKFYLCPEKLNTKPEYTLSQVDKYLVRDSDGKIMEVLPGNVELERRAVKL